MTGVEKTELRKEAAGYSRYKRNLVERATLLQRTSQTLGRIIDRYESEKSTNILEYIEALKVARQSVDTIAAENRTMARTFERYATQAVGKITSGSAQ